MLLNGGVSLEFLARKKKILNTAIIITGILDIVLAFIVNILSQTPFSLWKKGNIVAFIILIVLTVIMIVCNLIINYHNNNKARPKKLQKAFQQSGGYDIAAQEMSNCIKSGNLRKCKDIKKILKVIEK